MDRNPFDQFDPQAAAAPAAAETNPFDQFDLQANPFDQFDATPAPVVAPPVTSSPVVAPPVATSPPVAPPVAAAPAVAPPVTPSAPPPDPVSPGIMGFVQNLFDERTAAQPQEAVTQSGIDEKRAADLWQRRQMPNSPGGPHTGMGPLPTDVGTPLEELKKGFGSSALPQNERLIGQTLKAYEDATGDTTFAKSADEMITSGQAMQHDMTPPSVPQIQNIGINDLSVPPGALVKRIGAYVGGTAGNMAGSMLVPAATGAIGGWIGGRFGGKVGGTLGAGAGAYAGSDLLNIGSMRETLVELGVTDPKTRGKWSLIGGSAMSVLDSALPANIAGKLTGAIRHDLEVSFAKRLMMNGAKGALIEGGTEGAQEAIQELLGAYAADKGVDVHTLLWNVFENAMAGAIGGGPVSAVVESLPQPAEPGATPPPTPPPAAPAPAVEGAPPAAAAPPAAPVTPPAAETPPATASGLPPVDLPPQVPGSNFPSEAPAPKFAPGEAPVPPVGKAPPAPEDFRAPKTDTSTPSKSPGAAQQNAAPQNVSQETTPPAAHENPVLSIPEHGTTASVPFMISTPMRKRLADLGHTAEEIRNMKPAEAHAILQTPAWKRRQGTKANPVVAKTAMDLAPAREATNVSPTAQEKLSGKYDKGHAVVQGLAVQIENPRGSIRKGTGPNGKSYTSPPMPGDYGHVSRGNGADGDKFDVMIGPDHTAPHVYVIDQVNPTTGLHDEAKGIMGVHSEADARRMYTESYSNPAEAAKQISGVTEMPVKTFKEWVEAGGGRKPAATQAEAATKAHGNGLSIPTDQIRENPSGKIPEKAQDQGQTVGQKVAPVEVAGKKLETGKVEPRLFPETKVAEPVKQETKPAVPEKKVEPKVPVKEPAKAIEEAAATVARNQSKLSDEPLTEKTANRTGAFGRVLYHAATGFGYKIVDTGLFPTKGPFGKSYNFGTQLIDRLNPGDKLHQSLDRMTDAPPEVLAYVKTHMTAPWFHRVFWGHDPLANLSMIIDKFGVSSLPDYFAGLLKDMTSVAGIPLPGVQFLVQGGLVGDKVATAWLSMNVGEALSGGLSILSTYRLYKQNKNGQRIHRGWAIAGILFKTVGGVLSSNPVLLLSAGADTFILVRNTVAGAKAGMAKLDTIKTTGEGPLLGALGTEAQDAAITPPQDYVLTPEAKLRVDAMKKDIPGFAEVAKHLSDDELGILTPRKAKNLVKFYKNVPPADEMEAVAHAGRAKRGWYENSGKALVEIFGKADAPRFAALLGALSPQVSVQTNTTNALRVWATWVKAGRPTTKEGILQTMIGNVNGDNGEASILGAWKDNTVRALRGRNPHKLILSGPKVNSFMLNLMGYLDAVTNDAWMANYTGVSQDDFASNYAVQLPHKGAGYMAVTAVTRAAAKAAKSWSPAEVQEAVWSFTKALYEMASARGQTKSALQLLQDGALTHEEIASVPDFEKLFLEPRYSYLVEQAGYGKQLKELKKSVDGRRAAPYSGSVYTGASEAIKGHLRRAARRLDELIKERAIAAKRVEVQVSLSAATGSISGLKQLHEAANSGDQEAATILQEVARDSLSYLLGSIKKVKVHYTQTTGLYGGKVEPSLGLSISFRNADRGKVLVALAKFAENFNQEQFHLRQSAQRGLPAGYVYGDGSFNSRMVRFTLKQPLSQAQLQAAIEGSGLPGLSITPTTLETYYTGDPANAEAIRNFKDATDRLRTSLGHNVERAEGGLVRLWAYGSGDGATHSYGSISGKFRAPKGDKASATALRIASRLAGWAVRPQAQAPDITETQAELQKQIAQAYAVMSVNALSHPHVMRAYTELAQELLQQYDAMPIKVEIFDRKGEPYSGKKMSAEMRKDVLSNNHLFIFGTNEKTFGPEGVKYDGHPLLEDSGRTDINGKPLLMNDLLRAVHDYYAHTMAPVGFGPKGEEAAWRNHMMMTKSPWARWALTTETRGQNSWVNFRDEVQGKPLSDRPFADQKVDLLPIEFAQTGDPQIDASLGDLPGGEGLATGGGPVLLGAETGRAPVFFSGLLKAVQNMKQLKAPPGQWMSMIRNLPGVKQEEMEWLLLEDWLKKQQPSNHPGSVTKEQIENFIQDNQIQVQETINGEPSDAEIPNFANAEQAIAYIGEVRGMSRDEVIGTWPDYNTNAAFIDLAERIAAQGGVTSTRHGGYQTPGGKDYRELLLRLPTKKHSSEIVKDNKAGDYAIYIDGVLIDRAQRLDSAQAWLNSELSSMKRDESFVNTAHFDNPNIFAHIRFNTRTQGSDGFAVINTRNRNISKTFVTRKEAEDFRDGMPEMVRNSTQIEPAPTLTRTMFIEEIQSDFGQETRKSKLQIVRAVKEDFDVIIEKMKRDGVLEVNCD